ncbi:hypothetical protein SteCoe_21703 [Stentor coeruleus]|uniref:3-hydroxyisobutyryl-CoA hydrolase n=1 Tax=Stentor coeruleus TaxID=5963 RepID=A0A1R2BP12_9CILI|nr:hypothetical protein SteCoe_21703 [Stentor coeruleus]
MERLSLLYRHISPLVSFERENQSVVIKLNRPRSQNAINYDMFISMTNILSENSGKIIIFGSTSENFFSAGEDFNPSSESRLRIPEIYRTEIMMMHIINHEKLTLSIMQGITSGAGCALATACKFRISTESTSFSTTENSLGLVPDSGMGYFYSHMPNKALGLYLMLTGDNLNGPDCYWAKISTHYISNMMIKQVIQEIILKNDLEGCLKKYSMVPEKSQCKVLKNVEEINEIFGLVENIEELLQRLKNVKSEFGSMVLNRIRKLCPLSVYVSLRVFKFCASREYKVCLEKDFGIMMQMVMRRSYNYSTAIKEKFIDKNAGRVLWYPSTLEEVTQEMIETILKNPEGPHLTLPSLSY